MANGFEGMAQMQRALLALPTRLARNSLDRAVRAGGKPVIEAARSRAPVLSGKLRRSIRFRKSRGKGPLIRNGRVFAAAPHAHLLEFGTVKMAAKPFMRPAISAARDQSFAAMGAELRAGIEAAARELKVTP